MGFGLGKLQREILGSLDESKGWVSYRGCRDWEYGPGWVKSHGRYWQLPEGVYDLRGVLAYLAYRDQKYSQCSYVSSSFKASFSRAVKGLLIRRELHRCDYGGRPQVRFVSRKLR